MSQSNLNNTYVLKLLDDLMTPYRTTLNKQRAEILQPCLELSAPAVRWGTEYYLKKDGMRLETKGIPVATLAGLPVVPLSIHAQFEAVMSKDVGMQRDLAVLNQLLTTMLDTCTSEQDLRDALPEVMVPAELKQRLVRTRPAAYTLDNEPSKKRMYDKYYKKICYYASFRLLG